MTTLTNAALDPGTDERRNHDSDQTTDIWLCKKGGLIVKGSPSQPTRLIVAN